MFPLANTLPEVTGITPQDAAQLLTLVAPGYFAYTGYRIVNPARGRGELGLLVASVAFSLPLMAGAHALAKLLSIAPNPLTLVFAVLLIAVSLLSGYLLAQLRNLHTVRRLLAKLGYRVEPELTVLKRVLQRLPDPKAQATVRFKDGRVLAGTPRFTPGDTEDDNVYLDHTRWWNSGLSAWTDKRASGGVLISLSEVQSIEVNMDPE